MTANAAPVPSTLFAATVIAEEVDPVFSHIRESPHQGETRDYLEGLWAEYRPFADPNFLDQIQRRGQFHARVWEMRLTVVLKRLGLPVVQRKGVGGPDIRIDGEPPVWIEAVTPSPTQELLAACEAAKRATTQSRPDSILFRYTQVLKAKYEKLEHYLKNGLVAPSDGYVIAISGSALPLPSASGKYGEPPSVAYGLYGIGPYQWQIEIGTGRLLDAGWSHRPAASKPSGDPVDSDLFLSAKRAGISAVLYSPNDVQNRPQVYGRDDGWDFLLFHNEFATVPLDLGLIKRGQEWGTKDGELKVLRDYRNWSP